MRQLSLFVGGMSCRRCVREVTARLRDVPGVETASADSSRCTVRLTGSMTVGDVLAPFIATSYRPRLHGNPSSTSGDSGGDSGGTAFGKPGT
jgi:copper chaperone CopZ